VNGRGQEQGSRVKSVRQLRRLQGRVLASRCVIFEAVGDNLSLNKAFGFQPLVNFISLCCFFERRDPSALN
jgi:hypothetical protein